MKLKTILPTLSPYQLKVYQESKKSMVIAYVLALFLGAVGAQYLYIGRQRWVFVVGIISLMISVNVSWVAGINSIFWFVGIFHTCFSVQDKNVEIAKDCKILI